jgi:hypothetical protein
MTSGREGTNFVLLFVFTGLLVLGFGIELERGVVEEGVRAMLRKLIAVVK